MLKWCVIHSQYRQVYDSILSSSLRKEKSGDPILGSFLQLLTTQQCKFQKANHMHMVIQISSFLETNNNNYSTTLKELQGAHKLAFCALQLQTLLLSLAGEVIPIHAAPPPKHAFAGRPLPLFPSSQRPLFLLLLPFVEFKRTPNSLRHATLFPSSLTSIASLDSTVTFFSPPPSAFSTPTPACAASFIRRLALMSLVLTYLVRKPSSCSHCCFACDSSLLRTWLSFFSFSFSSVSWRKCCD